jgi:hypothetical protein
MFIKGKKKKKIFIQLLEGAEIKVPCWALHIQNNIFEIIKNESLDLEDKISIWEFFPGDLVKCEMVGENWVAKELISSTFPARKIHQLIFLIVKSLGKIVFDELLQYKSEIQQLFKSETIMQKDHPVVRSWIEKNSDRILAMQSETF